MNRCLTPSGNEKVECEEHAVPYEDGVPPDPTIEEMRKVVCDLGIRPEIPSRWSKSKVYKTNKIIHYIFLYFRAIYYEL